MSYTEKELDQLRKIIVGTISKQGFYVNGEVVPSTDEKAGLRDLHFFSKQDKLYAFKDFLKRNTEIVKAYAISGKDLEPGKIDLQLVEIIPNTKEEVLYRWWNLMWWSMPYQKAYGRQMRFIIWDKYHDAPFGIIGLQSPVLKMSVRDNYLNIPKNDLDVWVNRSMQAQRVGAFPPYNELLGGKMAALALASNEIREAYAIKYKDKVTLMEGRKLDSNLLFITTSSAYGRSSIYNRLKWRDENVAHKLGYTKGFGTFHIPDSVFSQIKKYLNEKGINTKTTFGNGPSKRIKLLSQAFAKLNLPNYSQHQILREYYLFPHVENLQKVIHANESPKYLDRPFNSLFEFWKERWCIPRSERRKSWSEFDPNWIIQDAEKL